MIALDFDFSALEDYGETLARALVPTPADLELGADELRRRILDRTARGIDASGQPFEPYSTSHARRRESRGFSSSRVDLEFSGQMLDAMESGAGKGGALRVGFSDSRQAKKAFWHQIGAGDLPARDFMRANDEDIDAVMAILIDRMLARI